MRKQVIAGNWKMNPRPEEAKELFNNLLDLLSDATNLPEIILATPSIYLQAFSKRDESKLTLAAQNCWHEMKGAFTGEISPQMLADLKIPYCLVGHSERREIFNENTEILAQKVNALLSIGIKPIFCCGEKLTERKHARHFEIVEEQIAGALFQIAKKDWDNIIIAYEPVWAIGTGETATTDQAQEMHAHIRAFIAKNVEKEIAESVRILYGGSVKPNNAKELFSCQDVDGGLVGGASLNANDFYKIIASH